jgi:Fe-S cluster assembly protein SufD
MTLAALPTTREEDWRYADPAALAALAPAALDGWREIALAPGETRTRDLVLDDVHGGVHRVRLDVAAGARAELFAVLSATTYTRLEVEVTLGEGAHFQFGGVTIGGGNVTREIVTRVNHSGPNATSDQVVRSVHWDTATGNFLGRIAVARDAQKTDAGQSFKGLLLSRGASANTKPELEIFADDVKCAHGAAIGRLDEAAAFYMAARGLPPEAARKLLVRAFVADAFTAHGEPDALLDAALGMLEDAA